MERWTRIYLSVFRDIGCDMSRRWPHDDVKKIVRITQMFGQVMNGSLQRRLEPLYHDDMRLSHGVGGKNIEGVSQRQRSATSAAILGVYEWLD